MRRWCRDVTVLWRIGFAVAAACGGGDDDGASGPDAGAVWRSVDTVFTDDDIIVEQVSYDVDGLRVFGQVCRPTAPEPRPIVVSNHGGFSGLGAELGADSGCRAAARNGYVMIESSYRGEDGSEGEVEVCLGEVDDVLVMLEIARAQPYADPDRVGMLGGSHGGCITLRAMQRGAPAQIGVAFAPPTDLAPLFEFWQEALPTVTGDAAAFYQLLIDTVETAAGGTPDEVPEEYARRSPISFVDDLVAVDGALFILHGDADVIVTPDQACELVSAAGGFESYHIGPDGLEVTSAPAGCAGSGLGWTAGPRPTTTWPGDRYLVIYDEVPHGFLPDHAPSAAAFNDFFGSIAVKLPI